MHFMHYFLDGDMNDHLLFPLILVSSQSPVAFTLFMNQVMVDIWIERWYYYISMF